MARYTLLLIATLALVSGVAAGQGQTETESVRWYSDLDAATKEVKRHKRPLLILFTMDNCLYCQKMKAGTYASQQVASKLASSFVASIVDGPRHPLLAERFKIKVYPTTVIISPGGHVVDSIPGFVSPTEMDRRLTAVNNLVRVALKQE